MKNEPRALFVVPCYYEGTSFERICTAIEYVISAHKLPIDILLGGRLKNTLRSGQLDDEQYTKAQAGILPLLLERLITGRYDRVLFIDFFNPGMELVRYLSDQTGKDIRMASLLHGGTFVEGDLYDDRWVHLAEELWGHLYNRVYVPSRYAYGQLPDKISEKARIYAWGMDDIMQSDAIQSPQVGQFDVIFPHRLNQDKGVDELREIIDALPDVNFLITSPATTHSMEALAFANMPNVSLVVCETTDAIHKAMGDSRIVLSCAKQELFGYSVAEAVAMGCTPIVPRNQVYVDMYDKSATYTNIAECIALIKRTLQDGPPSTYANKATSFLPLLKDFLDM